MPREHVMATDLPILSERTRRVLATLVREHIETGEPVASQALVRRGGFALSSATIRNILVMLEELGYLRQPHTSAGRVPTDLGYRSYVDRLLKRPRTSRPAALAEAQVLEQIANLPDADAETVLSTVPHMLAQATHAVAFALMPESATAAFHRIEFVPLGAGRVLVIVVARTSQVTHKVVDLDAGVGVRELEQAANYLNSEFSGLPLAEVRRAILERLSHERVLYDRVLARALRLARASFDGVGASRPLFVEGTSSLVDEVSEAHSGITLAALGALVRMIEEKHRLVHLLTKYIDGPGLTVVIGNEHPDPELREFSLVASTCADGDFAGTVGLIGPLRMQYLPCHPDGRPRGRVRLPAPEPRGQDAASGGLVSARNIQPRMTDEVLEQQPGGAAVDPGPGGPPQDPSTGKPASAEGDAGLEALRDELAQCHDRLLRTAAEFDNYRKRTERERREHADRTVEALLLDLVAVADDFERALDADAGGGSVEAYRQGVELTHRRLLDLLSRRGVTPIEATGADFDPNLHQAVTTEPAGNRRDGEVTEQLRRGYMIGERLLRPAMVKVART